MRHSTLEFTQGEYDDHHPWGFFALGISLPPPRNAAIVGTSAEQRSRLVQHSLKGYIRVVALGFAENRCDGLVQVRQHACVEHPVEH